MSETLDSGVSLSERADYVRMGRIIEHRYNASRPRRRLMVEVPLHASMAGYDTFGLLPRYGEEVAGLLDRPLGICDDSEPSLAGPPDKLPLIELGPSLMRAPDRWTSVDAHPRGRGPTHSGVAEMEAARLWTARAADLSAIDATPGDHRQRPLCGAGSPVGRSALAPPEVGGQDGPMRALRRMETPFVGAAVVVVLLGGTLVGGLMASGSAGAAPAPGQRVRAPVGSTSFSDAPAPPLAAHCGSGGQCGGPSGNLPNELNGVSCTSSTSCIAVGDYGHGMAVSGTLVESWNGSVWTVVPSPSPGTASELSGVSCTSPTNCVAVGNYVNTWPTYKTLVESWNGSAWTVVPSPNPDSSDNLLSGVSCTSPTNCVAVGTSANASGVFHTLVESWNGSTWTTASSPNPGSANNGLRSVSCTSSTNCVAVGGYGDGTASLTLVESWNGSAWTVVSSPYPTSIGASLSGVFCTSSTNCVAVGSYYLDSAHMLQTLVESWNGSAWTVVHSPNPGSTSGFGSVFCTSSTKCVAVGGYGEGFADRTLVESWNGSAWTVVSSPSPGITFADFLNGVSCTSSTACVAAGLYANGLEDVTLVESWNGTAWSVVPSPNVRTLVAPVVGMAATPSGNGYWLVDSAGDITTHGAAVNYGSMGGHPLNAPIAHIVATPDGKGYWLVASDGGTFSFGDAHFYGSMGDKQLNAPVVDMAPTPTGKGYWLVASDGGVFSFGDAVFSGSMGGQHLNQPVVGISADTATGGYWLVASDGGVFSFLAPFFGSMGAIPLNQPVTSMASTSDGHGYWFTASDGGVFAFGDAAFHGSMGGQHLNAPVVGMAADDPAGGYWLVATDGGIFSFGAPFFGAD